MKSGDVIVKAGDAEVRSPVDLIRKVSGRKPGEEVVIKFLRGDKAQETTVTLRSRAELNVSDQERMSHTARMGTRISQQRSGYPSALTHDMPVEPEACGTPLVNLEGEVVGVNIARAGRTKTYAIPGAVLLKLIK